MKKDLYVLIVLVTILFTSCSNPSSAFITTWKTTVDNEGITIYTRSEITDYKYHID